MTRPEKRSMVIARIELRSAAVEAGRLTTWPSRLAPHTDWKGWPGPIPTRLLASVYRLGGLAPAPTYKAPGFCIQAGRVGASPYLQGSHLLYIGMEGWRQPLPTRLLYIGWEGWGQPLPTMFTAPVYRLGGMAPTPTYKAPGFCI